MTQKTDTIAHPGRITKIENDEIEVMILSASACSSCSVKGACNMSEMEEKIVKVYNPKNNQMFQTGQQVTVYMQSAMGFNAVFLGYILPFLLILATLILMVSIGKSEGLAGLIALAILVPYYSLIYLFRAKLNKRFQFFIK